MFFTIDVMHVVKFSGTCIVLAVAGYTTYFSHYVLHSLSSLRRGPCLCARNPVEGLLRVQSVHVHNTLQCTLYSVFSPQTLHRVAKPCGGSPQGAECQRMKHFTVHSRPKHRTG